MNAKASPRHHRSRAATGGLAAAVLLAATGCGASDDEPLPIGGQGLAVRASVEQIHLWKASPETAFEVVDADGQPVAERVTDYQGSLIFRELEPGDGYTLRSVETPDEAVGPLTVLSVDSSQPEPSFYASQTLEPGFGYLTTRDGTKLSVFVSLPGPVEDGPYPTLVNYSGYSPSRPGQSLGGLAELFCDDYPILCDAPSFPTGIIAGLMGFAVVGVNMRGTGCSGGAYDYFETLQLLDGYDVIETVAAQDWVLRNEVGMVGLSYPGISQLFVASTRPPSLIAIAPMSVLADTATSTLVPGGIYNNGFALAWIEHVLSKAEPYGHGWIEDVVEAGDRICEDNQLLHSQVVDCVAKAYDNPYYTDEVAKPLDPSSFVDVIDVPVFMTGQWQDEQTGPHFPALFDKFTGAPVTRFGVTNGVHDDGFAPQMLGEWFNFLSLYVAQQVPVMDEVVRDLAPTFMADVFGSTLDLPPERFADYTDYQQALDDYEAEEPLRVIFETGAADGVEPGAPQGTFEAHFGGWPVPETEARRWYFQPDGSLAAEAPEEDGGASAFEPEPEAGQRTYLASGAVRDLQPDYDYRQLVDGKAVAFISDPLEEDLVVLGHGSVDLWLRSTATDADLEVNLTEVRPDGMESYVQSGWLRASHRALRSDATELRPVKSHYEEDVEPLEPSEWTEVRVELMPVAHIFRAGSRIRLSVDTPGDSRASWTFLVLEPDPLPAHSIGHHAAHPSSVVLSAVPGLTISTELPECHALRGQPCREYEPFVNTPE